MGWRMPSPPRSTTSTPRCATAGAQRGRPAAALCLLCGGALLPVHALPVCGQQRACPVIPRSLPPYYHTLRHAAPQVDPACIAKNDAAPMMEVQLELAASQLVWSPELATNSSGTGVRNMLDAWLRGMLEAGTLLRRLDTGEGALGEGWRGRVWRARREECCCCLCAHVV